MGGYYTGDDMERVQLELEVEDFLTSLPKDLEQIARLLCEGFSAAEIARKHWHKLHTGKSSAASVADFQFLVSWPVRSYYC